MELQAPRNLNEPLKKEGDDMSARKERGGGLMVVKPKCLLNNTVYLPKAGSTSDRQEPSDNLG